MDRISLMPGGVQASMPSNVVFPLLGKLAQPQPSDDTRTALKADMQTTHLLLCQTWATRSSAWTPWHQTGPLRPQFAVDRRAGRLRSIGWHLTLPPSHGGDSAPDLVQGGAVWQRHQRQGTGSRLQLGEQPRNYAGLSAQVRAHARGATDQPSARPVPRLSYLAGSSIHVRSRNK